MKAAKLLGIFIALLAIVIGALFLPEYCGSTSESTSVDSDPIVKDLTKELEYNWNDSIAWSMKQYEASESKLRQWKKEVGVNGYNTLSDRLNELSLKKLHQTMMGEFAKSDCNTSVINSLSSDLNKWMGFATKWKNDNRVKEMSGTCQLYKNALGLAGRKIVFSTGWSMSSNSWKPLAAQKNSLLSQRNSIKGNAYYKNIQSITAIANGLNSIESKITAAEKTYKQTLGNQIYDSYYRAERNNYNEDRLGSVLEKFRREFPAEKASYNRLNNLYKYYQ